MNSKFDATVHVRTSLGNRQPWLKPEPNPLESVSTFIGAGISGLPEVAVYNGSTLPMLPTKHRGMMPQTIQANRDNGIANKILWEQMADNKRHGTR